MYQRDRLRNIHRAIFQDRNNRHRSSPGHDGDMTVWKRCKQFNQSRLLPPHRQLDTCFQLASPYLFLFCHVVLQLNQLYNHLCTNPMEIAHLEHVHAQTTQSGIQSSGLNPSLATCFHSLDLIITVSSQFIFTQTLRT